eukprot:Opistho-2@76684
MDDSPVLQMIATVVADASQAWNIFSVFNDLIADKRWVDLDVKHIKDSQLTYICGRERPGGVLAAVVPVSARHPLSPSRIHSHFDALFPCTVHERQARQVSLVYAFVDNDSSIAYYKMHNGIHEHKS